MLVGVSGHESVVEWVKLVSGTSSQSEGVGNPYTCRHNFSTTPIPTLQSSLL